MQGKLISFSPKMNNGGVQDTYDGAKGTLYKFIVVMEINGANETGDALGKTTSPPWKVGDEYSFERKLQGAQGQFISYSKFENLTHPKAPFTPGGGGGKAGGIEFAKQKAAECAFRATSIFWSDEENFKHFKPEIYHAPAKVFFDHITSTNTEKDIWLNIAAFNALTERVDKVYQLSPVEGKKMVDLWIEEADKIRKSIEQMLTPVPQQ